MTTGKKCCSTADRAVGIDTRLRTGQNWTVRESISGREKRLLSSTKRPRWLWGSTILLCHGYRGFISTGKRPGVKLTISSSSDVKNAWRCNSVTPICLHYVDRNYFNFFFYTCVNKPNLLDYHRYVYGFHVK